MHKIFIPMIVYLCFFDLDKESQRVKSLWGICFSRDQWSDELITFFNSNVGLKSQKSCLEATNLILQNFENQETSLESPGSREKWLSAYFWAVLLMYPLGRNMIFVNLQYPKSCACFKFVYFLQYIIHLSDSCAVIFISIQESPKGDF